MIDHDFPQVPIISLFPLGTYAGRSDPCIKVISREMKRIQYH